MNGAWKIALGVGATVATAAYGYGVMAGDVHHNAESIGKNEAAIQRWEQLSRTALSNLARDSAVAATKIENIENGIAQLLAQNAERK